MAPGNIEAGKSLFYVTSQLKSYSNHQTSLNTVWLGSKKTFEGYGGRNKREDNTSRRHEHYRPLLNGWNIQLLESQSHYENIRIITCGYGWKVFGKTVENKGNQIILRNPIIQYVSTVKTVVLNASYNVSKRQFFKSFYFFIIYMSVCHPVRSSDWGTSWMSL